MSLFSVGAVAVLDFDIVLVETGVPTDPTQVTLTVTSPSGAVSHPSPLHDGTGSYRYELTLTEPGDWQYVWRATGAAADTKDGVIPVRAVGSTVIQIADVRARLNMPDSLDDDEIQQMIDAALAEYEEWVGPVGGTHTRRFAGGGNTVILPRGTTEVTAITYGDGSSADLSRTYVQDGLLKWGWGGYGHFPYDLTITYTVNGPPANHREAIIADVAGYFEAMNRGGGVSAMTFPDEVQPLPGAPMRNFPRIRALRQASIA